MELHRPARIESARERGPLMTVPPIRRTPMGPAGWRDPVLASRLRGVRPRIANGSAATAEGTNTPRASDTQLVRTAIVRRTIFTILALLQTAAFAYCMTTRILPYHGEQP